MRITKFFMTVALAAAVAFAVPHYQIWPNHREAKIIHNLKKLISRFLFCSHLIRISRAKTTAFFIISSE